MGGKAGTAGPRSRAASSSSSTRAPASAKRKAELAAKKAAAAAKKAEQARINGRKGGRPKKHNYVEIFADLLEAPEGDPLATCVWAQSICAAALRETLQDRGNRELNQEIRAFAGVIIRAVPTERLHEVEKKVKRAAAARREPAPAAGPPIENVTSRTTGPSGRAPVRG